MNQNYIKITLILLFSLVLVISINTQNGYIDPTGTYKLSHISKNKDTKSSGYTGQIQVKKVNSEKIIMDFEANKGAPSYNSGSFTRTLTYQKNEAIYSNIATDPSCKITFNFDKHGITVSEETDNFNSGCGFGHAVVADGFYQKTSAKVPVLTDKSP